MLKNIDKKKLVLMGCAYIAVIALMFLVILAISKYNPMRGSCGVDLKWVYDGDDTLTISGTGDMWDYSPPDGLVSGRFCVPWSAYKNEIKNVVIENGVTSIGDSAFEGHRSLKRVSIPNSVTRIGTIAFKYCDFTEITLPTNLTTIGEGSFQYCQKLKNITIPDSVTKIGSWTFHGCDNLNEVQLSANITELGPGSFQECRNLITVNLPDTLTTIGIQAFEHCESLTEIKVPKEVKNIGLYAFSYCTGLETITFLGDLPQIDANNHDSTWIFYDVTANAYFPSNNKTWEEYHKETFGGDVTWIPLP